MSDKSNDGYYEAYWPRGVRQQRTRALAPRLQSLEGKTVAGVDAVISGMAC